MSPNEYQSLARRTEAPINYVVIDRICRNDNPDDMDLTVRLIHAGLGLSTEAGEFLDALKRHIYYGAPLDTTNLAEEIGDVLWYCALAANAMGRDLSSVMEANIAKLRARFPDKFREHDALNRDLNAENAALNPA